MKFEVFWVQVLINESGVETGVVILRFEIHEIGVIELIDCADRD